MGCGTTTVRSNTSQPVPVAVEVPPDSTIPTEQASLKSFTLLLFSCGVVSESDPSLAEKFGSIISVGKPEEVEPAVGGSVNPVVLVSREEKYQEVSAFSEHNNHVAAVVILAAVSNGRENKHGGKKVAGAVKTLANVEVLLRNVCREYGRAQRFFDERTEKSFYGLEDKNLIVGSLRMQAKSDEFSIFYPLGMKAVNIRGILDDKLLDTIEQTVQKETAAELVKRAKSIVATIAHLRARGTDMKSVIESYTMPGLYFMLNLYLRYGKPDCLALFREYMFCLKGSMCELGKPMTDTGAVAYRGLRWDPKFLEEYRQKKGQCVLLNGFVSTSLDKKVAVEFANHGSGAGASTLLEMRLVECDDSYVRFIRDFEFPEENGVYFPVNISEFSVYSTEREVLFPPFYPIKIIDVDEETVDGQTYSRILAEVPNCVNISGKSRLSNMLKVQSSDVDWGKEYLDSMLRLSEHRIVDKLSLVNMNFLQYPGVFQRVLGLVKEGLCTQLIIEFEKLGPTDLASICKESLAGKLRRLSLNNTGLGEAGEEGEKMMELLLKDNLALTALELSANNIGKKGIQLIAEALRTNTALTELGLSANKMGPECGPIIAEALSHNRSLASLDLSYNKLDDKGLPPLATALENNTTLYTLNISFNDATMHGVRDFAAALGRNHTLASLYCVQEHIGDGEENDELDYLAYLRSFYLAQHCAKKNSDLVLPERQRAASSALKRNLDYTKIDMRQAHVYLKVNNVDKIAAILRVNETVAELNLEQSLNDGETIEPILAAAGENKDGKFAVLDLHHNRLPESSILALAKVLASGCSLLAIDLSICSVSTEAAAAVLASLGPTSKLRKLNLSGNSLGPNIAEGLEKALTGCQSLAGLGVGRALCMNSGLRVLKLDCVELGKESFRAIVGALEINKTLNKLYISECQMGNAEIMELFGDALVKNSTLSHLRITAGEELSPEASTALGKVLSTSKSLMSLQFARNTVANSVLRAVKEAVQTETSLKTLKFIGLDLAPDRLGLLAEIIRLNKKVTTLCMHAVFKDPASLKTLANELCDSKVISTLSFRGCGLHPESMKILGRILRRNTSIRTLNLRECYIEYSNIIRFANALRVNKTLTTLYIDRNKMVGNSKRQLVNSLMRNTTLTTLYMDGPIGMELKYMIMHAAFANRTLSKVIISGGRNVLMEFRDENMEQLKVYRRNRAIAMIQFFVKDGRAGTFTLMGCSVDADSMGALAESIKHKRNFADFMVMCNERGNACARPIADMLLVNTSIKALGYAANGSTSEAAKIFAEMLKKNTLLDTIYIALENIGDEGARALAEALKVNRGLTRIQLISCNIGDEGAAAIAEAVKVNSKICELDLRGNMIGNEGGKRLMEALAENKVIRKLDLTENQLEKAVAKILEDVNIRGRVTIEDLDSDIE